MHTKGSASLLPFAFLAPLAAQCSVSLTALGGPGGSAPIAYATHRWDPDGAGPLPPSVAVGGSFTSWNGQAVSVNGIGAYDPQTGAFTPFGTGLGTGIATKLASLPNGDLIVAGAFTTAGGVPALNIARWNGSTWAPLGAGIVGSISALHVLPNGDIAVGISAPTPSVSVWNGTAWSPLGTLSFYPSTFATAPSGELLIGGTPGIRRWNGAAWVVYAPGIVQVTAMAARPGGGLVAAGQVLASGLQLAEWNGTSWTATSASMVGSYYGPQVLDLDVLPDGDVIASGSFAIPGSPIAINNIARWRGSSWSFLLGGGSGLPPGAVYSATFMDEGSLVVVGGFNGLLARYATPCAAQAVAVGSGCAGSGGANALVATARPWIGGAFRALGTGLPTNAWVSQVYGLTPYALPLSAVLPIALPGCNLLVAPDYVRIDLVTTGAIETTLAIPDSAVLVGIPFHHQLNLFEIDAAGDFVAVTASNALALTVGVF